MAEKKRRICAVIAEERTAAAIESIKRAQGCADMIELRLDYLRDFDFSEPSALASLLGAATVPAIITCRSVEEGGKQHVPDSVRLPLLIEGARRHAAFCDVEASNYAAAARLAPDPSKLIVSYHNFSETPTDLDRIYEGLVSLPAAVHKIATRANSVADTVPIFKLLERARKENRNLIAIAMGEHGLLTRVLGLGQGGFLTYGSVSPGHESAPGQPSCAELVHSYRVGRLSKSTSLVGIIGSPVYHSASPAMHNRAFSELDLDFVYLPIEVTDLADFLRRFVRRGGDIDLGIRGLSVTIPHKVALLPLLDEVDGMAKRVGAVNTIVVEDGRLKGYNTDVSGSMSPLERLTPLAGMSCAVIGAGGAARAVVYGLTQRGARVTVLARDPAKAAVLAGEFDASAGSLGELSSNDAQIVINTTPIGMHGHAENESAVPAEALRGRLIAYDLVYNPIETRFLREAAEAGCKTVSGIDMLAGQAELQVQMWTGRQPPGGLMRTAAIEWLSR